MAKGFFGFVLFLGALLGVGYFLLPKAEDDTDENGNGDETDTVELTILSFGDGMYKVKVNGGDSEFSEDGTYTVDKGSTIKVETYPLVDAELNYVDPSKEFTINEDTELSISFSVIGSF